jgi:hypothetical protein
MYAWGIARAATNSADADRRDNFRDFVTPASGCDYFSVAANHAQRFRRFLAVSISQKL